MVVYVSVVVSLRSLRFSTATDRETIFVLPFSEKTILRPKLTLSCSTDISLTDPHSTMSDVSSSSSAPPSPASTSLTSLPSPGLQALTLRDVTNEDRAQAAKLKAEANNAFASMYSRPINHSSLTMGVQVVTSQRPLIFIRGPSN
jgi:hypothetical protein